MKEAVEAAKDAATATEAEKGGGVVQIALQGTMEAAVAGTTPGSLGTATRKVIEAWLVR